MKFFIMGSCVTRDAFSFEKDFECTIEDYIARYSLARIPGEKLNNIEDLSLALQSPFQKKIVKTELSNLALESLKSTEFDFLLMDFIDERFGLVSFNNIFVTASSELVNSKVLGDREIERITPHSSEFLELWEKGFVSILNSVQDKNKILINKVFWATSMDDGGEISSSNISYINKGNDLLKKLYSIASKYLKPAQFIEYPEGIFLADKNHKWGISPFHYVPNVYCFFLEEICNKCNENL